tara:strand:+ start:512 stop:697 length:186 start_codon:yes stop_codon:yes gene_type:complete
MVREIEFAVDAVNELVDNLAKDLASGRVSDADYRFVVGQIRGMRLAVDQMLQIKDEDEDVD